MFIIYQLIFIKTIAIVLPRVQGKLKHTCICLYLPSLIEHYSISDNLIGILSSSLFAGMTFGAFFWGTYSDAKGRKVPYTMTLLITSVFGTLSSFTFNFFTLCLCLFFLGFGVGGNMPTDGNIRTALDINIGSYSRFRRALFRILTQRVSLFTDIHVCLLFTWRGIGICLWLCDFAV